MEVFKETWLKPPIATNVGHFSNLSRCFLKHGFPQVLDRRVTFQRVSKSVATTCWPLSVRWLHVFRTCSQNATSRSKHHLQRGVPKPAQIVLARRGAQELSSDTLHNIPQCQDVSTNSSRQLIFMQRLPCRGIAESSSGFSFCYKQHPAKQCQRAFHPSPP